MRPCVFVLGTRAQLVKVAPVLRTASERGLDHLVWFTGQHRESIDDLIADFDIRSNVILPDVHEERSSVGKLLRWLPSTYRACRNFLASIAKEWGLAPLVVVHGDTLSTYLGARAARAVKADVAHLESGLTSGSLTDPFPEELLRRLTFRLTRYALCPNSYAAEVMSRYTDCEVVDTRENTLLDCVRFAMRGESGFEDGDDGDYFVASIHRFQNIYRRSNLETIVREMSDIASLSPLRFILHPPTESRLRHYGLLDGFADAPGVQLVPRMPYTRFLNTLGRARGVFSDGGSNQEELAYLGVPTLLYRDRSERPDGLDGNVALRKSVPGSLLDFVRSGGFDRQRRPQRLDDAAQPSRITVDALSRWCA